MIQGLAQAFLVRVPMSYILSIQPNASLTNIGYAAPSATAFGIILCLIYFVKMKKKDTALPEEQSDIVAQSYNSDISTVITIGRSYGAGGRTVGKLIPEKLNIPFFDKNLIVERDGLSEEKAIAKIHKDDKEWADYYNSLSGYGWGEAGSYDLCVDTDLVGLDGAAEMILKMVSIANKKLILKQQCLLIQ